MRKNILGRFNRELLLVVLAVLALVIVQQDRTTATPRFSTIRLSTGVQLRYLEQGDAGGRPVIMLHGYTDSWFSFSRALPGLGGGLRVYVLDQRGHGGSERPARGYTFADFAADVLAFMDAKGLKRASLVGHSMGSFIAQQVAATAPDRVERLVLIGSAPTVRNEAVLEFQRAVEGIGDVVPEAFAREFQLSAVHRPIPKAFLDRAVAESRRLPAETWRAIMAGMLAGDCRARLGEIRAPTLVLGGDRDAIFSRAEQEALAAQLPHAIVKIYPETGHSPHWERPEEFIRDLKNFLK